MTEKNSKIRDVVRNVESCASVCLASQPSEDDACERHLVRALAKMAKMTNEYIDLFEVEAFNIEWDTDGREVDLPKSVRIMMEESPEDIDKTIANKLSDKYGWCVRACNWRKV